MGDKVLAGALCATGLTFVVAVLFSAFAATGKGVFSLSAERVLSEFPTTLIPSGWTVSIWTLVFVWMAAALAFLITNIFRKKHADPAICSSPLCFTWMLSLWLYISWLFIWESKNPVASAMFMLFLSLVNWLLLGFFSKRLFQSKWDINETDLWLYRLLPQNALALYATWTTLASLVNLSIAVRYGPQLESKSATAANGDMLDLYLLCLLLILWFPLENFTFFDELHYVFTPYLAVIAGLAGILSSLSPPEVQSAEGTFAIALLVFTIVLFCIRILLVAYAHFKGHPLKKGSSTMLQITSLQF